MKKPPHHKPQKVGLEALLNTNNQSLSEYTNNMVKIFKFCKRESND